jgi:hypothetical protein
MTEGSSHDHTLERKYFEVGPRVKVGMVAASSRRARVVGCGVGNGNTIADTMLEPRAR